MRGVSAGTESSGGGVSSSRFDMDRHRCIAQLRFDGVGDLVAQLMGFFHGHVAIHADVKLDESVMSGLARAQLVHTADARRKRRDVPANQGFFVNRQTCVK